MKSINELPIKILTLYFPNGASVKQCDTIARKSQGVVNSNVSSGGFCHDKHMEKFSDDSMIYEYGYIKKKDNTKTT